MRMNKRNQSFLPLTGKLDSHDKERSTLFSKMTNIHTGRKKVIKLIGLIAIMQCLHAIHNDNSSLTRSRRATSTNNNNYSNNNLSDELESNSMVRADDIPLKGSGVGNTEAFLLGAWREHDGTNNDKDDEAQARALAKHMKAFAKLAKEDKHDYNGVLFGDTNYAATADASYADNDNDANDNARKDTNDRSFMSQIFGTKSKDNDAQANMDGHTDANANAAATNESNSNDEEAENLESQEIKRNMRTEKMRTAIQNMNLDEVDLDEINKLVEESIAQAGSGPAEVSNRMALPVSVPDRSYMVMPTPQEVLERSRATTMIAPNAPAMEEGPGEMGASLPPLSSSSNTNDAQGSPVADQSHPQSQNADLAMLLQQYSGEDLTAALNHLLNGEDGIDPNVSSDAQALPPPPQQQEQQMQMQIEEKRNLPPPGCTKAPRIPAPKQEPLRPSMIASYPGSGARLSWKLIRAITGYMTSDDAVDTDDLSKKGLVIAIKSHYPAHGSTDALFKPFANVDASVLLVRNPLKSMPSFLSYLYEREHDLENHSTRVPLDEWIKWRDAHFAKEIMSWVHHTLFWMEHSTKENSMVISYERLVDKETGPLEYAKLGGFLQRISGKELAQGPGDIPCVWDYIVNNRGDTSINGKMPQSLRKGPTKYSYTDEQIDTIVHYLESVGKMYPEELGEIMEGYANVAHSLKESNDA